MDSNVKNRLIKKYVTLGILFLTITLPITLFQVSQNQDNRSSAAAADKLEAEGGVLGGNATKQTDTNASGGNYIQFGQNVSLCPEANPNDNLADDAALQTCLNKGGIIAFTKGNPGYIIATGIVITKDQTTLTSKEANEKAVFIADPNLLNPMLKTVSTKSAGFVLKNLKFDGNRINRTTLSSCAQPTGKGINIVLNGANFTVDNIDVVNALCNSSFNIGTGTNFEIKNSRIADGGYADKTEPPGYSLASHLFADGLTIGNCNHGNIHDNIFENNTDTNLIIGGGDTCHATHNIIRQTTRFGHAGFWLNNFSCAVCGKGDHSNSYYAYNTIYAESPGALGAGLVINQNIVQKTTDPQLTVYKVKAVNNIIYGTGNNLLVGGGVDGIWVEGNVMSNPVGKVGGTAFASGPGCLRDLNEHYNYTAGGFTNSHLQPGFVKKTFDNFGCQTF